MMDNVLARQVGGSHYKDMPLQPTVFAMQAGYDACAFAILKHVCRHAKLDRGGPVDLDKAIHYVEIRSHTWGPWNYPRRHPGRGPSITLFCNLNSIHGAEREILVKLDTWVRNAHHVRAEELSADIARLRDTTYPPPPMSSML